MSLLAGHNLPFAIAIGAMLLLSLIQIIGLGDVFNVDVDADVEADASFDGSTTLMGGITTLLGIGRVPFLVWLMVFLFTFAAIGLGIQELAQALIGKPLFGWLAALLTAGFALPATAVMVRPLALVMPQDETDAVDIDTLVGRRAVITIGRATQGSPARARTRDMHGTIHYVMVEPHEAGGEIQQGEEILLVRRERQVFFGMPLAERRLSPVE